MSSLPPAPPPQGFHHVALKVHDFDRIVAMYKDGLGFKEKIRWGEGDSRGIMLDTGAGDYLEIFAGGPEEAFPVVGPMAMSGPAIHFAIRTADTDAATARAAAAGFKVTVPPKDVTIPSTPPTPIRISFVSGPLGEMIEFFQNELT
jgi:glyoxylase I family protein